MSDEPKSDEPKSDEPKSEETKSEETKPEETAAETEDAAAETGGGEETGAAEAPAEAESAAAESQASSAPSLVPAFIIVGLQLVACFGTLLFGSTNIQNVIGLGGAPLLALIALAIWWMSSRRLSLRERITGLAIFLVAIAIIAASQGAMGLYLLPVALPALTTVTVLLFAVSRNSPWQAQRRFVTSGIVACTIVFVLLRVDAIGGDLMPHLAFRWSPAPEAAVLELDEDPQGVAAVPDEAGAGDWPGFRGPHREGHLIGVRFGTNWAENPPRELWRRPVGLGWSSFAVVGDYAFTQEQRGDDELVVCYDANTGEPVWINRTTARFNDVTGDGPRATPMFHEAKLYTMGANGLVQCLDAATGKAIWQRDLKEDTGAKVPQWGFASSPTIVGDNVIVFSGAGGGASVVAYNKESGEVAWKSGAGDHGYASAQFVTIAGTPQILMPSIYGVQAFAPDSGEVLWEHAWDLGSFARITQPTMAEPNSVLFGSGPREGVRSLRIQKDEAGAWDIDVEWTAERFRPYFNDFVFHKGFCYGFDGNRLTCIDGGTGYRRWRGDRAGGQILAIDAMDAMLVLSEKGEVILLKATPNEPVEIARFDAIDGKTWNHPVIAHRKLFVRNAEEMACFELPAAEN